MMMTSQAGDEEDVDVVVATDKAVVKDVADVEVQETNSHLRFPLSPHAWTGQVEDYMAFSES
jgi:hypothetical protein